MTINWPLIIVLFVLSIPGVCIAIPRLIHFLLSNNSEELKSRFSRFAVVQLLIMVLLMSFAGMVLSLRTGLNAPLLEALLQGKVGISSIVPILLPTILYTCVGLVVFCGLYYGLVQSLIDERSFQVMKSMRSALRLDGCVLYGVVEEIIARWGLFNVVLFFAMLFAGQRTNAMILLSLILSGLLFAVGQIPAYRAAGCLPTRRVLYSIVMLSLCQSLLFGFLFWQYGLISAILAHMLFHIGWAQYDKI